MLKQLLPMTLALGLLSIFGDAARGQTARQSVPASEVNGTFRRSFSGKYKGSYNEIKILALGRGRLRVAFDLVYPFTDGTGQLSANLGQAEGIAAIIGDTAVYRTDEFGGECTITIKFIKPGTIRVEQEGASACGFGHNVTAAGTYTRSSRVKPKFSAP
jgi:hypothetical protein